jgi:hypothetical protein
MTFNLHSYFKFKVWKTGEKYSICHKSSKTGPNLLENFKILALKLLLGLVSMIGIAPFW